MMNDCGIRYTFAALAALWGAKIAAEQIQKQREEAKGSWWDRRADEREPTLYRAADQDLIPPPIESQGVVIHLDDQRRKR